MGIAGMPLYLLIMLIIAITTNVDIIIIIAPSPYCKVRPTNIFISAGPNDIDFDIISNAIYNTNAIKTFTLFDNNIL